MFDANKRLDDAIRAIKALPHTYQERALLSLRTLLADWESAKRRLDARHQAAKQRWAELNVEFSTACML
jgi:hypothetical protein